MRRSEYIWSIAFITILGMGLVVGCTEEDDDDITILIAGEEVSLDMIFGDYEAVTVTVNGQTYEGTSLSSLLNDTELAGPEDYQYEITASDDYSQVVTWGDMMRGILVEEETMTAFPGLPGKYRIRDVVKIVAVEADTILVNGHLFVWKQPFHIIDDTVTLMDNESNSYEGIYLSDVVNLTGLEDQSSHEYVIKASDLYEKNVTWEDMTKGILVMDENKSFFPHLESKYWVKDIVEIEVI
jgi:hypothetical protein